MVPTSTSRRRAMVTSGWWSGGECRAGTAQASAPPGGAHTAGAQQPQQTWPPGTTASASRKQETEALPPGSPHTESPLPASQALHPGCGRVARVQGQKRGPAQSSLMGNAKSRSETPWIPSAQETEIQLRLLCAVSLLDSCSSSGSAARDQQEGKVGVRLCWGRASREASVCSVDSCRESLGMRPLQRFLTHVCISSHQAETHSSHLQCPKDPWPCWHDSWAEVRGARSHGPDWVDPPSRVELVSPLQGTSSLHMHIHS